MATAGFGGGGSAGGNGGGEQEQTGVRAVWLAVAGAKDSVEQGVGGVRLVIWKGPGAGPEERRRGQGLAGEGTWERGAGAGAEAVGDRRGGRGTRGA